MKLFKTQVMMKRKDKRQRIPVLNGFLDFLLHRSVLQSIELEVNLMYFVMTWCLFSHRKMSQSGLVRKIVLNFPQLNLLKDCGNPLDLNPGKLTPFLPFLNILCPLPCLLIFFCLQEESSAHTGRQSFQIATKKLVGKSDANTPSAFCKCPIRNTNMNASPLLTGTSSNTNKLRSQVIGEI